MCRPRAGNTGATATTRYYLSSLAQASASELAGYIRGHWGIENHQHWHLDVTWDEDGCRCRRDQAPRNSPPCASWR